MGLADPIFHVELIKKATALNDIEEQHLMRNSFGILFLPEMFFDAFVLLHFNWIGQNVS